MASNIPNSVNFIPEIGISPSQKNNKNMGIKLNEATINNVSKNALDKPNGILIGDTLIKRITGPISVTILKPPMNPPFYMPPMILFGDVHFSTRGECEECKVVDGCYRISDPAFYQAFDRVSTKEEPIDFYLEYFMKDAPNEYPSSKSGEIFRTMEFFQQCAAWKTSEKKRYSLNSCPTKTIRYQYGDLRIADRQKVPGTEFDNLLEAMHTNPLWTSSTIIMRPKYPINRELGNPIIDAFDKFKGYNMEKMPDPTIYTEQMYQLLMNASPKYSRIAKQLQKMPKGFNPEWIKDIIYNSIVQKNVGRLKWKAWMMDLYTLLRIFKNPTNGPYSALSVMYYGILHIIPMTKFLTEKMGYEIIYSDARSMKEILKKNSRNRDERCIIFNKHIDINALITESHKQRQLFKKNNTNNTLKGGHRHAKKRVNRRTRKKLKSISKQRE